MTYPDPKAAKDYFEALCKMFFILLALCLLFVPLGMWKLIDILYWAASFV